jgi:hypothetical protein
MNSRRLAESHYGIPCADWLRTVMNRINPDLFMARFSSWVAECWPDAQSILDAEADYLLAVKDNQPTLHADIKSYFDTAPSDKIERFENLGQDPGSLFRSNSSSQAPYTALMRSVTFDAASKPVTKLPGKCVLGGISGE